jgi:hypothetical protein
VSGGTGREWPGPCPTVMGCGESCQVRQSAAGFVVGPSWLDGLSGPQPREHPDHPIGSV